MVTDPDDLVCPSCKIPRITRHPELFSLSIAHMDCDAFFAAIEKRDRPELADKPVIIGGGRRGVVSTACYVARTYGVHSAMPMFKALKACPNAVVIKPDFSKYVAASGRIREMMNGLTPLVEPLSIDEAFLDLTGTERLHDMPPAIALARLQNEIKSELGVTVSVGLSHNKFLAKLASDFDKPEGFFVIGRGETKSFLAKQKVSLIWGIGRKSAAILEKDGIRTIADLQALDAATLTNRYGEIGLRLSNLAFGRDDRPVKTSRETKSVSAETTFHEDHNDFTTLDDHLWHLCEKVSKRMKEKELAGRVVTLKLKTAQFKTLTRRTTLEQSSNLARTLYETASPLLHRECDGRKFRLIGVGYSALETDEDGERQSSLFGQNNQKLKAQEKAISAIRKKFGDDSIGAARTLKR